MTLEKFLIEKGAKKASIYEGTEQVKVLVLPLNQKGDGDRFITTILFDKEFPTTLYVTKNKMRGLTIVPHSSILTNHNDLHNTAKKNYLGLLDALKKAKVKYEVNEDTYNL